MVTVMVMMTVRRPPRTLLAGALGLACAGLAGASPVGGVFADASMAPAATVVHVVAAENFWGNIAGQLGGSDVRVTSLITNPNSDPHLFETSAADAATLAQAQVVVENGAGYDTWMQNLLSADAGHPGIVVAASVLHVGGSDPNPHLWYDIPRGRPPWPPPSPPHAKAAPQDAPAFRANLARFDASLLPVEVHAGHDQAAVPQRVGRLHRACAGLRGRHWPTSMSRPRPASAWSIEEGSDPGPADTLAMQQLITRHDINVLLYNVQTVTPVTTQIRACSPCSTPSPWWACSETMPAGVATYQQWQQSQLTHLLHALQSSRSP